MAAACLSYSKYILFLEVVLLYFNIIFPSNSIQFQFHNFSADDPNIVYLGSTGINGGEGGVGEVDFNVKARYYTSQVGWAIYAKRVLLWDSGTGQLTNFTTHYTFIIDTEGQSSYGHGLAFFLAPVGTHIRPNSTAGFLGLFNTDTKFWSSDPIVHVEFDTYPNAEFNETVQHVGINNNSIFSSVWTHWNASLHSKNPAQEEQGQGDSPTNFSMDRKLGQGGFGAVYRGYFPDSDLTVAVKKISRGSRQGRKEYVIEVKIISHVRHWNLLKLLGWCHDDEGEFPLIYEFMPNCSLDSHLFSESNYKPPLLGA